MLELTGFLEGKFGVKVATTEMLPENLDSIARMAIFITRKTTER